MSRTRRESSASVSVFGLGDEGEDGRWVRCARGRAHLDLGDAFQALHAPPRPQRVVYKRGTLRSKRFGDRPLVRFFHDGERVSVLVVCGDAPPGQRTKHGLEVRFGRKRDKGVSFAFGRVSGFVKEVWREGNALDAGARSQRLRLFPGVARE